MLLFKVAFLAAFLQISRSAVVRNDCSLSESLRNEIQGYQPIVNQIVEAVVNGKLKGDTYNSLAPFTDKFGHRLAGSKSLENAVDYLVKEFKNNGLENAHTEDAQILQWIRGSEQATMIHPRNADIKLLGLGSSVGTPQGGITGEIVVVESFDELENLPDDKVRGKIVVFAQTWVSYGVTVAYRSRGASAAAKKGAIAVLIKSITPFSIGSPHTGSQTYESGVKKIPAACITVEDADRLLRMHREGQSVVIRLSMNDYNGNVVTIRNTIGELTGSKFQNTSVVVLSGHLDSWDVGVGAMDDGGGAFISWKAVQYLKSLGLRPKRTIRAVMWTGEESGYIGAAQYERDHKNNEKDEFNFFMESDGGTFDPTGLDFTGNVEAQCIVKEVLSLMTSLNATQFQTPGGGPDISLWVNRGFPGASLLNKNERYFWFHHTEGDSMLLEDPASLDKCTALFAAVSYIIADLSIDMPRDLK